MNIPQQRTTPNNLSDRISYLNNIFLRATQPEPELLLLSVAMTMSLAQLAYLTLSMTDSELINFGNRNKAITPPLAFPDQTPFEMVEPVRMQTPTPDIVIVPITQVSQLNVVAIEPKEEVNVPSELERIRVNLREIDPTIFPTLLDESNSQALESLIDHMRRNNSAEKTLEKVISTFLLKVCKG